MAPQTRRNNLPAAKPRQTRALWRRAIPRRVSRVARACRSHPKTSISAVVIATLTITCAVALRPQQRHSPASVNPRTHLTVDYTACLLTGPGGVDTQPSAAVWAGMQKAATTTNERVTNQPMLGAQTSQNAEAFIDTLAAQKCKVIIATGTSPTAAATARTSAYPGIRFIIVTNSASSRTPGNETSVPILDAPKISSSIATELISDFNQHG